MFWDIIKIAIVVVLLIVFMGARDAWNERDAKFGPRAPASSVAK